MYIDIPKSLYQKSSVVVAQQLIGCRLVLDLPCGGEVGGVIVETEAYSSGDPACHAWHLEQKRLTRPEATGRGVELFGPPGFTYVYLNYGMYWLLNIITEPEGSPGAVLIRAIEPSLGEGVFWRNRPRVTKRENLANGPGKLTLAMGIDQRHHGISVTDGSLRLQRPRRRHVVLECSTRIGITKGTDRPWRFFIKGSPFVSPGKPS